MGRTREQGLKELSGKDVWRLYDTFGFPVDLTRLMAEELGLSINDKEFEEAQSWSKEASKASLKKGETTVIKLDVHDIAALEKDGTVPKTDDSAKFGILLTSRRFDLTLFRDWQYQCYCEDDILREAVPAIYI